MKKKLDGLTGIWYYNHVPDNKDTERIFKMSHYKNAIHAAVKALEAKHGKIGFSIRVYDYRKYILNIHSLSVDVMENAL